MKTSTLIILAGIATSIAQVESINDQIPGTLSGRVRTISMYRDFEGSPNGANTSAGIILEYTSPEFAGFDFGFAYNFADEVSENNNSTLMLNDDINLLNEGWLRYNFASLDLTNTTILVGRKITNGEVFRADDYRQKSRSLETVQFQTKDIANTQLTIGHASKLSNWIQAGDYANFNDFGDVFKTGYDTDGITWVEAVNTSISDLELAFFDAAAWDVSNLIGARAKWNVTDASALLGYFRHENDIGRADSRHSDAFGLSLQQKVGSVTVEPGFFSVHGSKLRFEEATTGINHALGASMAIYADQFAGGADTAYLKASTKINDTKLYVLYNYTWQGQQTFDGQELNFVAAQALTDALSVAFKGGLAYRNQEQSDNTTASEARLFVTYNF